jgi:hypothetical protein
LGIPGQIDIAAFEEPVLGGLVRTMRADLHNGDDFTPKNGDGDQITLPG